MATRSDLVVTLDGRVVDPTEPIVGLDAPMVARGDGVFETMLVRGGRPCLLTAHLDRLARSAAIVGLPAPDLARWRLAATTAATRWTDDGDAVLRLLYGRVTDGTAGFATVSELPERVAAARAHGVSALTLDRGDGAVAPWSVVGAKSMSYAVYAAALRHAQRLGVDDVVLVDAGGVVLEGPRSSVVIIDGDGMLLTPPVTLPILTGLTVRAVFDVAAARGVGCAERPLRVADLVAAQGVWLLSSVTLAARVHTLDGHDLQAPSSAVDMASLVDEAVTSPL
jgi:4-amino-4-deoxychorismate lyase